jgi:hypothetical protein
MAKGIPTAGHRIRVTRLENVGQVAMEHAKVYRELRRGKLEATLASRLSGILVNHRAILEQVDAEKRIAELERLLEEATKPREVAMLRKAA